MGAWKTIRKIWATAGTAVFVIFTTWSLLSYRARPEATAALDRAAQHRMTVEAIFSTLADALKNGDALQR
jgi:hypothetical protein